MSWLLVRTEGLGGGRSRLTFQIDGAARRIATVWGDPPSEETIAKVGELLEQEEQQRPIRPRYHLGEGA